MSAGGEIFLAGQYLVTWDSLDMGIMEGDSGVPTIEQINHAELINNTDAYGKSLIDGIYQGADFSAMFMCMEYREGSKGAWWPFDPIVATMGVIARLLYDMSSALVLTSIAGTPADDAGDPLTITAAAAILAPGFNTRLLFGPTLRKVPIRQVLFPYDNGDIVWYEET